MNNQNKPKEIEQNEPKYKWKTLAKNCVSQKTCPVLVGNGKYILFIGRHTDPHGIVMYDVHNDNYPQSLKSQNPKNTKFDAPGMAFNSKKNNISIWGGHCHSCFMIHDLSTKKWVPKVVKNTTKAFLLKYNMSRVGRHSRVIFDGQKIFHAIGGYNSNVHKVFNASKQLFEDRYIFKQFRSICAFGLVYDSMKDRLILFGGNDNGNHSESIWFFDLSINFWTECKDIKLSIPLSHFGFVHLDDIQIILLFGGQTTGFNKTLDTIFMLDFNNNSCTELHVKCPTKLNYHALLTQDPSTDQSSIHLFDMFSKDHWCMNLENILPSEYYQQFSDLINTPNTPLWNASSVSFSKLQEQLQLEMKEEKEIMLLELKQKDEQLQEKEAIIQQKNAIIEQNDKVQSDHESKIDGNFNFEPMEEEESLNMREKSFKSYFYSAVAKVADKYYESFVMNDFNDLEIVIELARMEDKNESLRILCKECGMNSLHARQLLRRLSDLSSSNTIFKEWFESNEMHEFYEMMLNAGVVTFKMLENTFVCCTDFVEFLGEENETQGIFMWRNIPKKKSLPEKKINSQTTFVDNGSESVVNVNSVINDEGYEGEESGL